MNSKLEQAVIVQGQAADLGRRASRQIVPSNRGQLGRDT
jgi:hypothetical protein